jgi:uncharacterized CHY-type Zn-finger protein
MTQQRKDRPVTPSARPSTLGGPSRRRRVGSVLGSVIASLVLAGLAWPGNEHWSAAGPMNTGHEQLSCDSCHRPAPGTVRQQLQANARYAIGLRAEPVDFGERRVENADCLSCHERPFDRHPVSRFSEPRFEKARAAAGVQRCAGCHREHTGTRVTSAMTVCENCHSDVKLRADPLDVSHAQLAQEGRFSTCLGCHDFHGNHVMKLAKNMSEVFAPEQIEAYLHGGRSPYPGLLRKPAKKERE